MKYNVKKNLEKKINNFISTEIEWIPLNSVQVSKEQEENLIEFFETLEDDDDVQNIFSNVELKLINAYNRNRPWNIWINMFF
jgi:transcriptional/translational regulatory protein YebC/TACO1